VQLLHDGTPSCWEGTFSTSSRNSTEIFSARSDP